MLQRSLIDTVWQAEMCIKDHLLTSVEILDVFLFIDILPKTAFYSNRVVGIGYYIRHLDCCVAVATNLLSAGIAQLGER